MLREKTSWSRRVREPFRDLITVRLDAGQRERLVELARVGGFESVSQCVRALIEREIREKSTGSV
jgi:hypothetical protein